MKHFLQSLLGSLTAFILLGFGCVVACLGFIALLATLGEQPLVDLESGSVLVLDLNTTIQDTPPITDFSVIMQEGRPPCRPRALKKSHNNPRGSKSG
jgi:hypothetical protein